MATPRKSSKKAAPAPAKERIEEEAADPASLAEQEAIARRDALQELLDAGYAVTSAGEDEKGHWLLAQRDDEEPKKIYIKGEKS